MSDKNDFDFTSATPAEIVTFVAGQLSMAEDRTLNALDFEEKAEDLATREKRVEDLLKRRTTITRSLPTARAELRVSRAIFADALSTANGANVSLTRLAEVTGMGKPALLRIMGRHKSSHEVACESPADQRE